MTQRLRSEPPSVELHVHIEGTLEPELIFELAKRNAIDLPYASVDELRDRYAFTDLESFLELYYANMAVLRTAADFTDMTHAYLRRSAAGGLRHAELFFDPQAHLLRGVPLDDCVGGIASAVATSDADYGVSTALIACFLRDRPVEEALEVLEELIAAEAPIIGIGLDSAERGHPPAAFLPVYQRAREHGLRLVAHAGEEGPAEYVWQALDVLGVERVDHGVRAMDDDALVRRLVEEQVPLTVCPLSNVRLKGVESLTEHPLPAMLERGLLVTVNSDDPAYFGGYVGDNYTALAEAFGLGQDTLARLARNGVAAAFIDDTRRAQLLDEIAVWQAVSS